MRLFTPAGVFSPLSDTWLLAEQLRAEPGLRGGSVLDVCTGSGALAIASWLAGAGHVNAAGGPPCLTPARAGRAGRRGPRSAARQAPGRHGRARRGSAGAARAGRSGELARGELARIDLVEQAVDVVQLEVLGEVALGLLAGGSVQGHVERDQPRSLRPVLGLSALVGLRRGVVGGLGGRFLGLLDRLVGLRELGVSGSRLGLLLGGLLLGGFLIGG